MSAPLVPTGKLNRMPSMTVFVTREQQEKLRALSARTKIPQNVLVRAALDRFLATAEHLPDFGGGNEVEP